MKHSEVVSTQAQQLLEQEGSIKRLSEQANSEVKKARRSELLREKYHRNYKLVKKALDTAKKQAAYWQTKFSNSRSIDLFTTKELFMELLLRFELANIMYKKYGKGKMDKRQTDSRAD